MWLSHDRAQISILRLAFPFSSFIQRLLVNIVGKQAGARLYNPSQKDPGQVIKTSNRRFVFVFVKGHRSPWRVTKTLFVWTPGESILFTPDVSNSNCQEVVARPIA